MSQALEAYAGQATSIVETETSAVPANDDPLTPDDD
jgi:hypothetical protein